MGMQMMSTRTDLFKNEFTLTILQWSIYMGYGLQKLKGGYP